MSSVLMDYNEKKEHIKRLLHQMRALRAELSRLLSTPTWFDYEEYVKNKSKELFGEVKEFYSPAQVAKLLSVDLRSITYRMERGGIVVIGGKIPFEQVVVLAEYFKVKEELKRFADEYRKRFEQCNRTD